ncbi:receptor-like kinase TMK3 [Prunus yedoensis var. nudiflora]|uniref:Receptor-like kinase TMK3 n=1 Tax=Prunus yedoensis var. nudiflora TaxID=2094558 RepID=A0A314Z4W3_PRUYE|nr:receptor-like kinase TMK3 [Prunus yedoensis var. nudiflora]
MEGGWRWRLCNFLVLCLFMVAYGITFPGDLKILNDFRKGLENSELLNWPENGDDPCGPPSWPHVFCSGDRVAQIQVQNMGLKGPLPQNFNQLSKLYNLGLQRNNFNGKLPTFSGLSELELLIWIRTCWLHGNQFTGTIPENIGNLSSLKELNLNGNHLVGLIPQTLADMELDKLDLGNNQLMGPIPKFKSEVTALLDFLGDLNYPSSLASEWSGNNPCEGRWLGLSCNPQSKVSVINLPRHKLNGTLSPALAKLDSLVDVRLPGNNITGKVPTNFTELKSLRLLDISGNNIEPPLPKFPDSLKVIAEGNPLLVGSGKPPKSPLSKSPPSPITHPDQNPSGAIQVDVQPQSSKRPKPVIIIAGIAVVGVVAFLLICLSIYYCKKRKNLLEAPASVVIHPRDPSDPENLYKIAVASNTTGSLSTKTRTTVSHNSGGTENSHMIEAGNLVISVQVLRKVTKNFAPENELGRGGFGTVYKGELEDGTQLAVKRMEGAVISSKALDEFEAEIAVLSKVRHRHLVSLLGYSIEGNERLLVYEYMSQGALSRHLFHWKSLNLKPLSWTRRLTIVLDVARAMEYLHNLARQTFIHRDLKSSNILLGDDFHAKVSDFGLVKLAPDGEKSIATKLAGTFGYLAPEYAVMGKITTKADVFSFGVVLMELLTGLMALDENRPEESRYLAEWFWRIKSSKEKLMAAIDPTLEVNEETFESISIITELAGHCTAREPSHRPDMGHAVNVLSLLVEKWKPVEDESDCLSGIDYNQPLPQMLKVWQEAESRGISYTSLADSKGSIPARPNGFAESFTSTDGR